MTSTQWSFDIFNDEALISRLWWDFQGNTGKEEITDIGYITKADKALTFRFVTIHSI